MTTLTTEQIAERCQVHVSTVRDWIKTGKLRAWKEGQVLRIDEDAFDDFKRSREVVPSPPKLKAISGGRL